MEPIEILNLEGEVQDNPISVWLFRPPDETFAMACSLTATAHLSRVGGYHPVDISLEILVRTDDVGESCTVMVITVPPTMVLSFVRGADEFTFVLQLREVDAGGWVVSSKIYILPAEDPPHWGEDEEPQSVRTTLKQLFAVETKRNAWFQEFPVKLVG